MIEVSFNASRLKSIFEDRIWKKKLLPSIRKGLERANQELEGKPISAVLLSGGSANIKWIKPLNKKRSCGLFP
jgi:hypothetical protein